jgi:hypothetical protein
VVGGRQGCGHGLVGAAAHDVRVRAVVNVEFLLKGCRVFGQGEAELPVLGAPPRREDRLASTGSPTQSASA